MKILLGITKSNWGGAQRYVHDIALAGKEAGHDTTVLAGGSGILIEKLRKSGIRVITLPALRRDISFLGDIESFRNILRILREEKPDVFHINSSKMGGLGALAGRIAGIKNIIFTAHGWAFNEFRHWAQLIIIEELAWITIMLSHKTICVSEAMKRAVDHLPLIKDKLVVIKHGVEAFDLKPRDESRDLLLPGAGKDTLIFGTISELHRSTKGIDILLEGWSLFRKARKIGELVIIGSGEAEADLKERAVNLDIKGNVHFLGHIDEARRLLKGFDVFTLTSRTEALGYVLLEAGQAALPVIATNIGGIPEIVRNNDTGILIQSERPAALAAALIKLSLSAEKRKTLGENLHKFVTKNFSKKRMLEETLSLYR